MAISYHEIEGGVCAVKGFQAAGIHCGIRKNQSKKDLALIYCEKRCHAAAVYTTNKVKGAPITVCKEHLLDGMAQAVIVNSGNANTCNADGVEKANRMCELVAGALGIEEKDVLIGSTGVIGMVLDLEPIERGIPQLVSQLTDAPSGSADCVHAMMTTDLNPKEIAIECEIGGKTVHIGGVAKGSGMIKPNMATMLSFATTDVAISSAMLQKAVTLSVGDTFNMVSVDGDTSTNDTYAVLASGLAGNREITEENEDFRAFTEALTVVNRYLAREMARDGEGATKLIECNVLGAPDRLNAKKIALSVISSSLFKAAMFGADANWGRVLCAMGYADAQFDITKCSVTFSSPAGSIQVCRDGAGIPFDEDKAKEILLQKEITVDIDLFDGDAQATAWGCDLTYDYVKINGDYRS